MQAEHVVSYYLALRPDPIDAAEAAVSALPDGKSVVIVVGGAGGLGTVVVATLKKAGYAVVAVDLRANAEAHRSVIVPVGTDLKTLDKQLEDVAQRGFSMGGVQQDDALETLKRMVSFNLESAALAAHIAARTLKPNANSLLVLTGAQAGLAGSPAFYAYGMTKAATHQLVQSLASEQSGLAEGTTVAALLPQTLDTPTNRKDMPNADHSSWTPLGYVADLLVQWIQGKERPQNGALVAITTKSGQTTKQVVTGGSASGSAVEQALALVGQLDEAALEQLLAAVQQAKAKKSAPEPVLKKDTKEKKKEEEDDVDLFADEEDDAEHQAEIQRRADELEAKKKAAGKVREAAKSAIVLDVKPWDDETDLKKMEEGVRAIEMEGLDWKASKLQPIGYGIKKLQISCHVVDDLVSVDDLIEKIQDGLPDLVQSVDVSTFTKL